MFIGDISSPGAFFLVFSMVSGSKDVHSPNHMLFFLRLSFSSCLANFCAVRFPCPPANPSAAALLWFCCSLLAVDFSES